MLTQRELDLIDAYLNDGLTPEETAEEMGMTRTGMNFKLLSSGKKIAIYRRLVDTRPADAEVSPAQRGQLVDARA